MKSFVALIITLIICLSCKAQGSEAWENFKNAKRNGVEPLLPDFSYAGYYYSERPIPVIEDTVFNVIDYGAIPNDSQSDKNAIVRAIQDAEDQGHGIVYFPVGTYVVNSEHDELDPIVINGSNIVLRGEKKEGQKAVLFFKSELPARDKTKLWTSPYAIQTKRHVKKDILAKIVEGARRETHAIKVDNVSKINVGDWVIISVTNNNKDFIEQDIAPLTPDLSWTSILNKGVQVSERHLIESIDGNTVNLKEPIRYSIDPKYGWELIAFEPSTHVGFENLEFEGNWLEKFEHHKSIQHDGGWSILKLDNLVNSWVKDCRFKNVNRAVSISRSSACTVINVSIEGNSGHNAISVQNGSSGILLAKINDMAGMHHTTGVGGGYTSGTVIWRSKHPANTCFDAHASQPRCTLFDNVEGGFFKGRAGGARHNLPNHGRYLVLWNYKETDSADTDFEFIAKDSWYWKIVPPIIVGFHGAGTTFKKEEVQWEESNGKPVEPESLFEAQLALRLGKLPDWINEHLVTKIKLEHDTKKQKQ